jgi:transcriptional regulator with XRE-family HTH domain
MQPRTWRERLALAVKRDRRSLRSISLAAGLGPNFLSELLRTKKEPTIGPFEKVCTELKTSTSYILDGFELSPSAMRLLRAFSDLPEEQQETFLAFVENQRRR